MYSLPVSTPVGFVAGLLAGELARHVTKEAGGSERAAEVACKVAHWGASSLAGWAVNAVTLDAAGAVAQPAAAYAGAELHEAIRSGLQHPAIFAAFEQARAT